MFHGYQDNEGEQRKALYAGIKKLDVEQTLEQQILGKRTRL